MFPFLYIQNFTEKFAYPMSYTRFNLEKIRRPETLFVEADNDM